MVGMKPNMNTFRFKTDDVFQIDTKIGGKKCTILTMKFHMAYS